MSPTFAPRRLDRAVSHGSPVAPRMSPSASSSPSSDRRASTPSPSTQLAHQLAAETLLTMAPATSKSPDTRHEGSVPAPIPAAAAAPAKITPDTTEESRGVKRKLEEESKLSTPASLGVGLEKEREASKDRGYSHSPLPANESRPQPLPSRANSSPFAQRPTPSQNPTASRYSIYGPTDRHLASLGPLPGSPWGGGLSSRYNALGIRREVPSGPPGAAPKTIAADASSRLPPDIHRDARFYPGASSSSTSTSMSGYGHYSMGRRELVEHREQLREGKRWLETMLAKTDKMLHMVENKMALTGEMGSAAVSTIAAAAAASTAPLVASASSGANGSSKHDDRDVEEHEWARQKEIKRLEEERERDRVTRDKREHEMAEKERSSAGLSNREKSEAERNRDFLLASRRVSTVSPNGRERSTPTAAGATAEAAEISGPKPGAWDGDPVMAGMALPRRNQGALHRQLGRGLWSFDIRG